MRGVGISVLLLFIISGGAIDSRAGTQQFPIAKDPQAIAILRAAIMAMGGLQAILAYQDSQAMGTFAISESGTPINYPVILKSKGTQETRVELQKPSGTSVRVVNHGQGAITRPDGSVLRLSMKNTIGERVNHIPLLSILSEFQNGNVSVQYQKTSLVGNHTTDVIAVSFVPSNDPVQGPKFASLTQTLFYVDQNTSLIDKIQYSDFDQHGSDASQLVEVVLSNYQNVDGIAIPFHQITYTDGALYSDFILNTISFNVGLSDSEFALP